MCRAVAKHYIQGKMHSRVVYVFSHFAACLDIFTIRCTAPYRPVKGKHKQTQFILPANWNCEQQDMQTFAAEWCASYSVDLLHVSPANGGHLQTLAERAKTRSNISWFLWHPACSHSRELTFIPPRWSRLNQKHTARPLSATAYYVWLPGQNA